MLVPHKHIHTHAHIHMLTQTHTHTHTHTHKGVVKFKELRLILMNSQILFFIYYFFYGFCDNCCQNN